MTGARDEIVVGRAEEIAVGPRDVVHAPTAVRKAPARFALASGIASNTVAAESVAGAASAWTLKGAIPRSPSVVASARAVSSGSVEAQAVTRAGTIDVGDVAITLFVAVRTEGRAITVEATESRFVTGIAHAQALAIVSSAALTATPARGAELSTGTGFVAILAEVAGSAHAAV